VTSDEDDVGKGCPSMGKTDEYVGQIKELLFQRAECLTMTDITDMLGIPQK
jgi:hypothetical protein